jgi:hypothetical protein
MLMHEVSEKEEELSRKRAKIVSFDVVKMSDCFMLAMPRKIRNWKLLRDFFFSITNLASWPVLVLNCTRIINAAISLQVFLNPPHFG